MTVAFITTLRHPQNSVDYSRVEGLLQDTLHSLANQTSDDFAVFVVGNRKPGFPLPPRTTFVFVDFPAPAPPNGARTDREPFVRDKGTKVAVGLLAARELAPASVMLVDADDFVHRDVVSYVSDHAADRGWVITRGIVYSRSRGVWRPQNDFNRKCGTSMVLPYTAYTVPSDLSVAASQSELINAFGETLPRVLGAHRDAVPWLAARGLRLEPVPFRAAAYHVDTGENHSGNEMDGLALPLTARLASCYGIPRARGTAHAFLKGLGPTALAQSALSSTRLVLRAAKHTVASFSSAASGTE